MNNKFNILIVTALGAVLIALSFLLTDIAKHVCFYVGLALVVASVVAFVYALQKESKDDGNRYKQKRLMTEPELEFYNLLKRNYEPKYKVLPQIALLSLVDKTTNTSYRNELFRIVDFVIFDGNFTPLCAVELNDASHNRSDRKERDEKVKTILEKAGVCIVFVPKDVANEERVVRKIISDSTRRKL